MHSIKITDSSYILFISLIKASEVFNFYKINIIADLHMEFAIFSKGRVHVTGIRKLFFRIVLNNKRRKGNIKGKTNETG